MPEWDDSFEPSGSHAEEPIPPPQRPTGLWIAAGVLVLVAAGGVYLMLRSKPAPEQAAAPKADAAKPAAPAADTGKIDLPPLDQTDAVVRDLVRKLSSHPTIAAWLATDGLIRNFTVVVVNVAEGKTPVRFLRPLKPAAPFAVISPGGDLHVDPKSYTRYTEFSDAIASIDPAGGAKLYTTLRPRIEDAAKDLGNTEPFDKTLERAIKVLLDTPIPEGPPRVTETGATGYKYDDESLESLSGAQKQLLRMGPDNARAVQANLKQFLDALHAQ